MSAPGTRSAPTPEPSRASSPGRSTERAPATARALGVLLVLETATYASLTVLALVSAAIAYAARDKGGFGDIAAVLSVVVALIAVLLGLLTFAAWVTLRRRNPAALPLTIVAHAVPVVGLLLLRSSVGTLLGLTVAWTVVGVLGIALAVFPATRRWLARPAG